MPTEKVNQILTVTFAGKPGHPGILIIQAAGENGNSNMSDVRLVLVEYNKPPADGIWEYSMIGEEPEIVDHIGGKHGI
jgi:hypothetical protein